MTWVQAENCESIVKLQKNIVDSVSLGACRYKQKLWHAFDRLLLDQDIMNWWFVEMLGTRSQNDQSLLEHCRSEDRSA